MLTTRALVVALLLGVPHSAPAQTASAGGVTFPLPPVPASVSRFVPNEGSPGRVPGRATSERAVSLVQGQPGTAASAERKGFLIGIGGGPSRHRRAGVTLRNAAGTVIFSTPAASSLAIVTDFKVGYAPSDQILLYYVNKAAFTQDERYDAVGLSGVGVTYMVRPTSPSAFVTGSIGAGAGRNLVESSDAESGAGFSFGAGFEFARHWSFDGDVIVVRLGAGDTHLVVKGGVSVLFY